MQLYAFEPQRYHEIDVAFVVVRVREDAAESDYLLAVVYARRPLVDGLGLALFGDDGEHDGLVHAVRVHVGGEAAESHVRAVGVGAVRVFHEHGAGARSQRVGEDVCVKIYEHNALLLSP